MLTILRLTLRMIGRDARAGELTVLGFAMVLAVMALTSVSFVTDRVQQALIQQSHQLLGGDLLLTADHPWPAKGGQDPRDKAGELGLAVAESITFPSMVSADGSTQLADIKAVTGNYPLRGALRIADHSGEPGLSDHETHEIPSPGSVWVDERLLGALGARMGSSIVVGNSRLQVSAVLVVEPDKGFNVFAFAPRLMMNNEDLFATGLIQIGSRANWRLHLAGAPAAVASFREWAGRHIGRGEKIESLDNARPEVRVLLERVQRFLGLAALLAVILATVAIAMTADRYVRRHLNGCAVMRCLGAQSRRVLAIHLGEFLIFGALATAVGCVAGYSLQHLLASQIGRLLNTDLPAASLQPWLLGGATGVVLMTGAALPPLLRFRQVPAIAVLRREWGEVRSWPHWLAAAISLGLLMLWVGGDSTLSLIVIGGFALIAGIYAVLTTVLLVMLRSLASTGAIPGWRLGLAGLYRRRRNTLIQAVALALGLTALLLLTAGRSDLLTSWKSRLPADAPNRFAINIQPDQREAVADFFRNQHVNASLEPMVRGRLVAINGRAVNANDYGEPQARNLLEREFNLSWSTQLPAGNTISGGNWHGPSATPQFSVEQGLAEKLHLQLGDELTYDIAGTRIKAPITSLRKLDWDSMRVNFFVIASQGLLESSAASYITSFHLPPERNEAVNALVRLFPNLTVIDVASLMRQLEEAIEQAARAIEAVFGFALVAGLVVLIAVFQTTRDERVREMAILRALGASRRQLLQSLAAESMALGGLAGLLAGAGASGLSLVLARQVFHLAYLPNIMLPLLSVGIGMVVASCAALLGVGRVLNVGPMRVLGNEAAII
ncbi:MAG: FtsX-like permease family protein [Verrucomicrobia bacterium]|nr:MAG: FtsX-like permease family protein [Verrucomicrobiota bacterium]